ncbi:MAG: WD40 repeat domain-containing protein, partial [Bacteroidota bacterium]
SLYTFSIIYEIKDFFDCRIAEDVCPNTSLSKGTPTTWTIKFSPDGQRLIGTTGAYIKVWSLAEDRLIYAFCPNQSEIFDFALTPDENLLLTVGSDGTSKVWDLSLQPGWKGKTQSTYSWLKNPPHHLTLEQYEGEEWHPLDSTHNRSIKSVAIAPNSNWAVTGSGNHSARIHDLSTGETTFTLIGHTGSVSHVLFTPDYNFVITASTSETDQSIRLWNMRTGSQAASFIETHYDPAAFPHLKEWNFAHFGAVLDIALSNNGRWLVSCSGDREIKVWDVSTQEVIARAALEGRPVNCAIAPDNETIMIGCTAGHVHFLRLENPPEASLLGNRLFRTPQGGPDETDAILNKTEQEKATSLKWPPTRVLNAKYSFPPNPCKDNEDL